jgi:hypothetical protein
MSDVQFNFVRQQGFEGTTAATCGAQFPALMFQPRVTGVFVLVAVVLQAPLLFLALSARLWWNALVPALNPFDAVYDRVVARKGMPLLTPAPGPRRFAQGMAATFMLLIGVSLLAGALVAAWVLQALLLVALGALIFGGFCLGSFLFHLLRGQAAFAMRTLPWSRGA